MRCSRSWCYGNGPGQPGRRKDVLSGLFFWLTLLAYSNYIEQRKVRSSKSNIFYGVALLLFACGLMSKPMLVTVPFLLLLLDFWPLQRFVDGNLRAVMGKLVL